MDKKKVILIVIVSFIVILIMILTQNKNKVELSLNGTNIVNTEYCFDEMNSVYVIYDKNTNEVLKTVSDYTMVKIYLDNPDFDPSFPTSDFSEMND